MQIYAKNENLHIEPLDRLKRISVKTSLFILFFNRTIMSKSVSVLVIYQNKRFFREPLWSGVSSTS